MCIVYAGRHSWSYYTSKQSAPSQMTSHDSNALGLTQLAAIYTSQLTDWALWLGTICTEFSEPVHRHQHTVSQEHCMHQVFGCAYRRHMPVRDAYQSQT